jgi:aldehyde dehydrogenase (NAD+)
MTSTTTGFVITHDRFYIDGQWHKPLGSGRITVISPNTAEIIGEVPEGVPADIDAAVAAARRAFDDPRGWSSLAPTERAAHMRRFADEIDLRKDAFATWSPRRTACRSASPDRWRPSSLPFYSAITQT